MSSKPPLNLLVAYPYAKADVINTIKQNEGNIRFVLDSGAFTAWKAGKPIQLDDYCRYLDSLPFEPWRYFSLDVIGDPEASMKNYETMLKRGFNPVPIFTRGEDPSVLDDYYKTSDVVGIGGLVGTPKNKAFVNAIMRRNKGRKVHWLGFTPLDFIKHYRPYMCDSSSWEGGARFATLRLYIGGGRFVTVKKTDFIKEPNSIIKRAMDNFEVSWYEMRDDAAWSGGRSHCRRLCAESGVAFSTDVERNIKTKVFMAATTTMAIELLIEAWERQK